MPLPPATHRSPTASRHSFDAQALTITGEITIAGPAGPNPRLIVDGFNFGRATDYPEGWMFFGWEAEARFGRHAGPVVFNPIGWDSFVAPGPISTPGGAGNAQGPAPLPRTDADLNRFAVNRGFVLPPRWQMYFVDKIEKGLGDAYGPTKVIRISREALTSPSRLASTIRHELVHAKQWQQNNWAGNALGVIVNQLEAVEAQLAFAAKDGLNGAKIEAIKAAQRDLIAQLLREPGHEYYWQRIKKNAVDRFVLRAEDRYPQ